MVNVLRVLIVLVAFTVGIIIGNIYLPQKNFDQKNIAVTQKPKTSLNIENVPSADTVLKQAEFYKNILIESGQNQEEIIGFENNFKRTILQLYYKETSANYTLELFKIQMQPENTAAFIKARNEYKKITNLIENLYPLEEHKEVLVIKEEKQPLIPSTSTVQNIEDLTVSTGTILTSQNRN